MIRENKGKRMENCIGILDLCTKIPVKFKKVICSFFFLFFWSAQNFSYCSWLVLPSLGRKQLALEAFVMSRLRLDITKLASLANCFLPCEGKKSLTVRKIFLTQKREKKRTKYYFLLFVTFFPFTREETIGSRSLWNVSTSSRHFKIGFSSQLFPPLWREKRSLTVRKIFLTPKREKKSNK